jgi:hypothetical protein
VSERSLASSAAPELVVTIDGTDRTLRAAEGDVWFADPFWAHTLSGWLRAIGVQLAMTAVFALVAWWRLVRISPGRTRRRCTTRQVAGPAWPPRIGREGR